MRSFVDLERDGKSEEAGVIQSFFDRVDDHRPQLVSWNGGGFDLPVLQQRGLRHGVVAGRYWDMGDDDREHRYNNYISRYHLRHIDLMDLLAMYQSRANAPLDAMAKLCGFPGKLGMDGSQVYGAYLEGRRDEIRRYCETDAMNTYLLWCRFEKMRGHLDEAGYRREIAHRPRRGGSDRRAALAEYLVPAWPAEETARCATARGLPSPAGRPRRPAPAVRGIAAGRRSRRRSRSSRRRPRRRRPRRRSTSIPRASARSRRASPGAGWSCGCGRPSRRR